MEDTHTHYHIHADDTGHAHEHRHPDEDVIYSPNLTMYHRLHAEHQHGGSIFDHDG